MGLLPLEFTDGLTDSPYFRETLTAHERELDRTNVAIKHLIKDIKDLIFCAKNLSRAQRVLSETLKNFNFECIGTSQTDDEMVIANSFKDFARLLSTIEDERDRLLEKAEEAFLEPIERFRRDQIGSAKEAKKKFDKETTKHCQNLEKYLNTSTKKGGTQLQEADANYSIEQWHFFNAMSEYVLKLQEVNERKKFEFVETVLSFMLGWLTFYHQGHEIATDFYSVKMELQMRLQRTRNNFNMTQEETKCLRQKMLNNSDKFRQKLEDHGSLNKMYTRQGYLFLMEKKAFSTSWTKHFCQYEKSSRRLTMIQYTQTAGKIASTEEITVKECFRRPTDLIDRRFCFDIVPDNSGGFVRGVGNGSANDPGSPGNSQNGGSGVSSFSGGASASATTSSSAGQNSGSNVNSSNGSSSSRDDYVVYTFQALSEEDYKLWFEALEGKERKGGLNGPSTSSGLGGGGSGGGGGGGKKTSFKFGGGGSSSSSSADHHHHHHHHMNLPLTASPDNAETFELDEEGFYFLRKCIQAIEDRGVEQKGIYRVVGVASKVRSLMEAFGEKRQLAKRRGSSSAGGESGGGSNSAMPQQPGGGGGSSASPSASGESCEEELVAPLFELNLDSEENFELKTLTSALKNYLRNLAEPIMTFGLHEEFISAAKLENRSMRIDRIHTLVHQLPPLNFKVLKTLVEHLTRVANQSEKNLMTASNLGVCFGPTLLRTAEESVAAILDIKFVNVIAEMLIEHYETIFLSPPPSTPPTETDHAFGQHQMSAHTSSSPSGGDGGVSVGGAATIQQRPLPTVPNSSHHHHIQMVSPYHQNSSPTTVQQQQQQQLHLPLSPQQLDTSSMVFFAGNAAGGSPTSSSALGGVPAQQYRYSVHPSATARNAAYFPAGGSSHHHHHPNHAHQTVKQLSPSTDVYGRLALMPSAAVPRRSSSQDQLYSGIIMGGAGGGGAGGGGGHHHSNSSVAIQQARARASALYGGVSPTASAAQMMQMAQQQQQQQQQLQRPHNLPTQLSASNYATYPNQHQGIVGRKQQQQQPPQHLNNSLLQPSSPMQINQGQNALLYQSPSSAIYGHLMQQQQQQQQQRPVAVGGLSQMAVIQPSISYQNLHYESSMAVAAAAAGELANYGQSSAGHQQQLYNHSQRPMTSIGFAMPNNRVDGSGGGGGGGGGVVGGSGLYQQFQHPQQLIQQQQQQQQQSTSPPSQTLLSASSSARPFALSSTSSASLPSTPEHSSANFHYGVLPTAAAATGARTPTAAHSLQHQQQQQKSMQTLPPISNNTYEQIAAIGGDGAILSTAHHQKPQQQQTIYGTIGQVRGGGVVPQLSSPPGTATAIVVQQEIQKEASVDSKQSPLSLPSSKVRTRYVCIGGNDSELSFQPNMIITNVRPSREPGWIEGYLNGRTGLVPLNYVEFIE